MIFSYRVVDFFQFLSVPVPDCFLTFPPFLIARSIDISDQVGAPDMQSTYGIDIVSVWQLPRGVHTYATSAQNEESVWDTSNGIVTLLTNAQLHRRTATIPFCVSLTLPYEVVIFLKKIRKCEQKRAR